MTLGAVAAETFRSAMSTAMPEVLSLTEALVNTDSGSRDPIGVNAVNALLEEALSPTGMTVRRHAVAGFGDCLDALAQVGSGPRVVILGHADTVWPAGTVQDWPLTETDGWLSGPGVGDMKAALAMTTAVLKLTVGRDDLPVGSIRFVVTPEEQLGSVATRSLLEQIADDADVCLTLEAVQDQGGMVVERGAVGALTLTARGRTAHCTEPGGASVITELSPLLARIEGLTDQAAGVQVSIGMVTAGTARQVVPDYGEVHIDVRGRTAGAAAAAVARLHSLVDEPRVVDGVVLDLAGSVTRPAMSRERSESLYRLAAAAAARLGLPSRAVTERGGSDASFFADRGVSTLDGLGPFTVASCSRRERVQVSSIAERGAILAAVIASAADAHREIA